jgi:hypothetical protein
MVAAWKRPATWSTAAVWSSSSTGQRARLMPTKAADLQRHGALRAGAGLYRATRRCCRCRCCCCWRRGSCNSCCCCLRGLRPGKCCHCWWLCVMTPCTAATVTTRKALSTWLSAGRTGTKMTTVGVATMSACAGHSTRGRAAWWCCQGLCATGQRVAAAATCAADTLSQWAGPAAAATAAAAAAVVGAVVRDLAREWGQALKIQKKWRGDNQRARILVRKETSARTHLHGPAWQGAVSLWLPQRSRRLHTSSQGGQLLPSQQRRLQACRPHARRLVHFDSQRTSVWHSTCRCILPHRQALVTSSRQVDGQGP